MSPRQMFRGRARFTSATAILVVAGVLTGTMLANAAGPALGKRTPAQLLAAMRNARPPAAMTAVITENANLGFPSLPNIAGLQSPLLSAAGLISGTHTVDIWYDGPRHVRIALPVSFGETDLRVNGNQVWLWDSHGQTATHYILPTPPSLPAPPSLSAPAPPAARTPAQIKSIKARFAPFKIAQSKLALPRCLEGLKPPKLMTRSRKIPVAITKCLNGLKLNSLKGVHRIAFAFRPLTPIQAADKLLAAVGPTTKVTVAGSTVVAGRSAYQLVIAPRTNQSLISQIVIAVDSATYLPLQLQVFARGMSSPAFQIGFTSLTFGVPAASNFTFTPPRGAHVKTEKLPQFMPGSIAPFLMGGLSAPLPTPFTGQRMLGGSSAKHVAVFVRPRALKIRIAKLMKLVGKAKRVRFAISAMSSQAVISSQTVISSRAVVPSSGPAGGALSGVKVLGSGWLSVAVIPIGNGSLGVGLPSVQAPAKVGSRVIIGKAPGGPQPVAIGSSGQASELIALLRVLLNSAARVHGAWGSGRLLRTSLFSVLITNNGKVLIGAVTPAVLYADAAKVK